MFKPSQVNFPLLPIKNSLEYLNNLTYCNLCRNETRHYQIANKDVPNNSFKINKIRNLYSSIFFVCKNCRRWIPFDCSKFVSSYNNLLSKTQEEWILYKKDIFKKYPAHIAVILFKYLKRERYYLLTNKSWEDQFFKFEVIWIKSKYSELSCDYECVDNFRVADISKKKQVRRYNKQRQSGCCGSFDTTVTCYWNLKKYYLGFNYGH